MEFKVESMLKRSGYVFFISYINAGMKMYCRTQTGARRWFNTEVEARKFANGLSTYPNEY